MQTRNRLFLKLIEEKDVDFLLSLRLNNNLNQYLGCVTNDRHAQLNWIQEYKNRENAGLDFYFVIVDRVYDELGFLRVYDIDWTNKHFTWGSWVLREGRPKYAALESALLCYEFAFNELNLEKCYFRVDNQNEHTIRFHNRFGAKYLYCDESNSFFELTKMEYICLKYSRYSEFI